MRTFFGVVLAVVGTMCAAIGFWLVAAGATGLLVPSALSALIAVAGFAMTCYGEEDD